MKKHNGMKPQDVVILLYICQYVDGCYRVLDIAKALKISQSEVSESLHRSRFARLIGNNKKVFRSALFEFLLHGLRYVFPAEPGRVIKGMPTSHSAEPLSNDIVSGNENFVWPYSKGVSRGMSIEPLYKTLPEICSDLRELWELLALADALRVGRARERNLAEKYLAERLLNAQ
jgi:hypothetical protein